MGNTAANQLPTRSPTFHQTPPSQASKTPWNGRQAPTPPQQTVREPWNRPAPTPPQQTVREPWNDRQAQTPYMGRRGIEPWNDNQATKTPMYNEWESIRPNSLGHTPPESLNMDHTGYNRGANQQTGRDHVPRRPGPAQRQPDRAMERWGPASEYNPRRRDQFPAYRGYDDLYMNWFPEDPNGPRHWFQPEPYRDYMWRRDYDFVGY
ncbi:Hypp2382 [Branchiostoma lanceolatum]|uniref:Hypp2382 protein n=1 Tax=Branchiostoma lanceolatum TaxID=7740 RepID=A0A8J9ZQ67_BRALA|nr:Hypp2382 [Branchiostoma lanceolatum]